MYIALFFLFLFTIYFSRNILVTIVYKWNELMDYRGWWYMMININLKKNQVATKLP